MAYIFEKGSTLGKGGTAKIYRCQDSIGIRSVCKVIPKLATPREKFQKEINCLIDLSFSPKVVSLYDVFETDDDYYIIMEWCRGGAVRDYTSNYTLYSENTVASILRGVLRGLVHVHKAGIIHRDIKPGNILLSDLSEDAEVKITDFGSALRYEVSDDVIETNDMTGTPYYMAPETLRYTCHPKSDIWSLGVMAYQLITGFMPFDDFNEDPPRIHMIWKSIFNDEPKWIGKRWENISEDAKDFVKTCLNKEWNQRPSAEELLVHPWLQKTNCGDRFGGTPIKLRKFKYEGNSLMHAKTWSGFDK